jgi:flotillin
MQNSYLEEVVAGTHQVEASLKPRAVANALSSAGPVSSRGAAIPIRTTGWWRWKTLVVPPNAFVIHTRRGVGKPLHCGLGISFRFNPYTDAFLVAPAAMQTIIVNANCICAERQGVMVQAYVQWVIDDFERAYQGLDLSDPLDPMRVTNVQLQQQAEATIKDTVATMSIDAVLSDKQPIIKELKRRLKEVSEGADGGGGLGIRIATIQIKEAVVSSAELWETLQRGFRAERAKEARLAELASQSVVRETETFESLKSERQTLEKMDAVRHLKSESEANAFDAQQAEISRRARLTAAQAEEKATCQRQVLMHEAELTRLEVQQAADAQRLKFDQEMEEERIRLAAYAERLKIDNGIGGEQLRSRLISQLPEIAKHMPKPDSLRIYQGTSENQMGTLISDVMEVFEKVAK